MNPIQVVSLWMILFGVLLIYLLSREGGIRRRRCQRCTRWVSVENADVAFVRFKGGKGRVAYYHRYNCIELTHGLF